MPEQPLVSIIIPTYNRAHLIGETLDSVLAQTYHNWECIVVDDGSTDKTEALLNSYILKDSRFQYHKRPNEHLSGGNGSRNYGFLKSKGDYIQWFDSDDVMRSDKLELSIKAIEINNKDLVVSNISIIEHPNKKIKLEFDNLLKFHVSDGKINTPMCFFKRDTLSGFTFNEELVRSQEFEFFTRLFSSKEIDFAIIDQSLSHIKSHSDSITGNYETGDVNAISSMLFAKLEAIKFSANLDQATKDTVNNRFEKALWKSLIFRHKKVYWKYLRLYLDHNSSIGIYKKLKLRVLPFLYFTFNRGGQFIRKQFID